MESEEWGSANSGRGPATGWQEVVLDDAGKGCLEVTVVAPADPFREGNFSMSPRRGLKQRYPLFQDGSSPPVRSSGVEPYDEDEEES